MIGDGNLLVRMEFFTNLIIDRFYNSGISKMLLYPEELMTCVKNGYRLFNLQFQQVARTSTTFDVINDKINCNYKIQLEQSEVKELLSIFNSNDPGILTLFSGIQLFDLSHEAIVEKVLHKHCFEFTSINFRRPLDANAQKSFFHLADWKLAIA